MEACTEGLNLDYRERANVVRRDRLYEGGESSQDGDSVVWDVSDVSLKRDLV